MHGWEKSDESLFSGAEQLGYYEILMDLGLS